MPRKSAAALAVISPITDHQPPPPAELTEAEADEWRAIVGRLPREWITREVQPLLVAFLKHQSTHRALCKLVEEFDMTLLKVDLGVGHYGKLLGLRARESKAMQELATKLRLTNQARYLPHTAARQAQRQEFGSIDADGKIKLAPWQKHV